jgi:hypothetical protein
LPEIGSGEHLTNVGWSIWLGFLGLAALWGSLSWRSLACGGIGFTLECGFALLLEYVAVICVAAAVGFGIWAIFAWRREP